jgi:iron complex outermembrane recepter protein
VTNSKTAKRIFLASSIASALAPTAILAQEQQQTNIDEIIVTAQKRAERLQDVPISISVLGGGDLDQSTFTGVTEALNTVPGVAAFANTFQSSGTQLSFRGVSAAQAFSGGGASTVGYYVDSVPFGMIGSALVPDPNVYDLSRIEVLRGPQGTLYGANALNGVVRVLTNDPDLNDFDFKARDSTSSTQDGGANYGGDAAVNLPIIDGKLAARVTAGVDHESGWINGPLGNHLNSSESNNVRAKLRWRPVDDLTVDFSVWHSQQAYDAPALSTSDRWNFALTPEPSYTQFNAYGVKIDYELPLFSISSMTSDVTYLANNLLFPHPVITVINSLSTDSTSRVYSEEITLASKLEGPWKWTAGGMYRNDKDTANEPGFNYPDPTPVVQYGAGTETSKSYAAYGELGRRLFDDHWQLAAGLRYFHDDEAAINTAPPGAITSISSATTPRVTLNWFPTQQLTAYATYSEGFRSGVPQPPSVTVVAPDFPTLKPDKLDNYELGVKGVLWDQVLSYEAAVYHLKWKDIQQSLSFLAPGPTGTTGYVSALINADSASGNGVEFSLDARPLQGLELTAQWGWNDLHFDSDVYSGGGVLFPKGSRPNNSPKETAGASAKYTFPIAGTGVSGVLAASGNYISPLNIVWLSAGTESQNSLLLTKASFSLDFSQNWLVTLFVDNANNYHGTQYIAIGYDQWSTRQRPRTVGLSFEYHLPRK